jgi:hypothetical protein
MLTTIYFRLPKVLTEVRRIHKSHVPKDYNSLFHCDKASIILQVQMSNQLLYFTDSEWYEVLDGWDRKFKIEFIRNAHRGVI